jgi:hypothetical protein
VHAGPGALVYRDYGFTLIEVTAAPVADRVAVMDRFL